MQKKSFKPPSMAVKLQGETKSMNTENVAPNREYKDRLFKAIYGRNTEQSKKWRLELYNALNGTNYKNPEDIELTTIENVIYITMKNDVSFLIGDEMNLFEQQSTFNPNMPLRGLMYFAQLYQMNISKRGLDLFGTTLVKIPSPKFVVFYIGDTDCPDVVKFKLSDAFEHKQTNNEFEWTATMLNINLGHNKSLHKNCKSLYAYSKYIDSVKKNLKKMPRQQAIECAVNQAIDEKLLDGFFKDQKMEVMNMSLTEFDQEEYDRNRRREGREEGLIQGERKAKIEAARNALSMNLSVEQVAQITDLPLEEVLALKEQK